MSRAASPGLRGEIYAAGHNESGLPLQRSNPLRSDLRAASFGGGGASAKVDVAGRLSGEAVKALWVKGSGSMSARRVVNVEAISFSR